MTQAEPLFKKYRNMDTANLISALDEIDESEELETEEDAIDFGQFVPKAGTEADEE